MNKEDIENMDVKDWKIIALEASIEQLNTVIKARDKEIEQLLLKQ